MAKNGDSNENWNLVIKPKVGLLNFNLGEIWRYRDLVGMFVQRDFVAIYKQTILGPAWFLLQPIMNTIVYTFIFGDIAQLSSDGLPRTVFYFSGTMMWQYFAGCFIKTSDTFIANAGMFGKVYFPRLTVPVANVITNLITFGIQFVIFIAILVFFILAGYPLRPSLWVLSLPILLVSMAALGLGAGVIVSAMTTKYRDLRHLVTFGVSLWMYATPVVFPLSQVPERWRWVFLLNPMSAIIETFRVAFTGTGTVNPQQLGVSAAGILIILFIGIVMFNRVERTFMDVV